VKTPLPLLPLLLGLACSPGQAPDPDQPQPGTAEPASTERRTDPSTASAAPAPSTPAAPGQDSPAEPQLDVQVRLTALGTAQAEGPDGRLTSDQAVAVDLSSGGWPGEAMEPSLEIQGVRFERYTHSDPVTLRFVVANPSLVPTGATALVRYGDRVVAELTLPAVEGL